jgi:transcriptional regulator with XRE-family HTH domain
MTKKTISCLSENLKQARKAKGWSQTELAEKLETHLTHVSRVERGKYTPSIDFVAKAAKVLGVSLDSLVAENGEGLQDVHIEDKDLADRLRLLETLESQERDALITVMDSMLTKHRMRKLLEGNQTARA